MAKTNTLHILAPLLSPRDATPKTNDDMAIYMLRRDLEQLKWELRLERERNHHKNLMLTDEADFLEEILETRQPIREAELRRRISRVKGALRKFEPSKEGL